MISVLALIFSLIAPGAGHVLEGLYAEGFIIGILFAFGKSTFLPLLLRVFNVASLKRTLQILYTCNLFYMLLILYAAVSSLIRGFNAQQIHFWQAVLFAVAVTLSYKKTLNAFIFTALCGRTGVYPLLRMKKETPTEKK